MVAVARAHLVLELLVLRLLHAPEPPHVPQLAVPVLRLLGTGRQCSAVLDHAPTRALDLHPPEKTEDDEDNTANRCANYGLGAGVANSLGLWRAPISILEEVTEGRGGGSRGNSGQSCGNCRGA